MVVTAPNMGGKSTYLKQIALTQVMAQIGSYVPAESAEVRMTDQIFSLLSHEDDPGLDLSHWSKEVRLKSLSKTERQNWLPNSEVETSCPLGPFRARSLYFRVGQPNLTLRYGNSI